MLPLKAWGNFRNPAACGILARCRSPTCLTASSCTISFASTGGSWPSSGRIEDGWPPPGRSWPPTAFWPWPCPGACERVVDSAFVRADLGLLTRITGGLMVLFAVRSVLDFGQTYLLGWTAERVVANLRAELYARLQSMPLGFFNVTPLGDLLSRLGNDVMVIQDAVTSTLLSLLSELIMFVGGVVLILIMDWRLTLVMLATTPLAVLGGALLGTLVQRISRQVQDALAELGAMAEQALAGVRIVKSFAASRSRRRATEKAPRSSFTSPCAGSVCERPLGRPLACWPTPRSPSSSGLEDGKSSAGPSPQASWSLLCSIP